MFVHPESQGTEDLYQLMLSKVCGRSTYPLCFTPGIEKCRDAKGRKLNAMSWQIGPLTLKESEDSK